MAHEIDLSNGKAAMAYVGEKPWHGLGAELKLGASIEVWKQQAGMDWEILQTQVRYDDGDDMAAFPNQTVLYRSDNKNPLSIVSGDYKIVQPGEVIEFFRDMVAGLGMQLQTAGCLYGGKRFWALADTGNAAQILKNDLVKGMLLLTSSCDGKLSTSAQFTSVRVVCNNTLSIAMNEDTKKVRTTHARVFDPMETKSRMQLLDSSWVRFRDQMKELSKIKVSDDKARKTYMNLMKDPEKTVEDQSTAVHKAVNEMMNRYRNGMGAQMSYGTAWGVLNGLTEYADYNGRASADAKLWGSWNGRTANLKDEGLQLILKQHNLETV